VGFRDYYRQFDDIDEAALNLERRERRRREKQAALERAPDIDLAGTEWPDLPYSEIVNAAIARARGRVNGYPDRHATAARRLLAERHGLEPDRIALGNGAAELLHSAALALLSAGDELVMPWPSYPLYPLMASRAGARPVAVPDLDALRAALTDHTRVVVLCNPNDPTGTYLRAETVAGLASDLPDHVHLLVDEALVQFQDVEAPDSVLRLVDAFPRLLVFRTFSKIYGLSGLRAGYAVGSNASSRILDAIAPVLGVNALTQSAVDQALKIGGPEVERRRVTVIQERGRVLKALRDLPVAVSDSQANFVWIAAEGMSGSLLASRMREEGVIVAPGGPLGADDHVRAAIRDPASSGRLLSALEKALAG
jgi:histidinol-phosphate aminotransferase